MPNKLLLLTCFFLCPIVVADLVKRYGYWPHEDRDINKCVSAWKALSQMRNNTRKVFFVCFLFVFVLFFFLISQVTCLTTYLKFLVYQNYIRVDVRVYEYAILLDCTSIYVLMYTVYIHVRIQ